MALPQRRADCDSDSLTTEVRWGWSSRMSLAAAWGRLRAWASTQHAHTRLDRPRPRCPTGSTRSVCTASQRRTDPLPWSMRSSASTLIERRALPLDNGMERLLAEVSAHRNEAAPRLGVCLVRVRQQDSGIRAPAVQGDCTTSEAGLVACASAELVHLSANSPSWHRSRDDHAGVESWVADPTGERWRSVCPRGAPRRCYDVCRLDGSAPLDPEALHCSPDLWERWPSG